MKARSLIDCLFKEYLRFLANLLIFHVYKDSQVPNQLGIIKLCNFFVFNLQFLSLYNPLDDRVNHMTQENVTVIVLTQLAVILNKGLSYQNLSHEPQRGNCILRVIHNQLRELER